MIIAIPLPFIWALFRLARFISGSLRRAWQTEEFRGLAYVILIVIGIGTVAFHQIEGWGWLDSLYFVVMTLTTIGYGDFAPETSFGKIFTIFYVMLGLGIFAAFITIFAQHALAQNTERATVLPLLKTKQSTLENTNAQETDS